MPMRNESRKARWTDQEQPVVRGEERQRGEAISNGIVKTDWPVWETAQEFFTEDREQKAG